MRLFHVDSPASCAVPVRTRFVYDGDDVPDALIRSSHFAVHVYSGGGISVLATRDDGRVDDAVLDDAGQSCVLTIHGCTGSSARPSAAAAMAELDWRNSVMQVLAACPSFACATAISPPPPLPSLTHSLFLPPAHPRASSAPHPPLLPPPPLLPHPPSLPR